MGTRANTHDKSTWDPTQKWLNNTVKALLGNTNWGDHFTCQAYIRWSRRQQPLQCSKMDYPKFIFIFLFFFNYLYFYLSLSVAEIRLLVMNSPKDRKGRGKGWNDICVSTGSLKSKELWMAWKWSKTLIACQVFTEKTQWMVVRSLICA